MTARLFTKSLLAAVAALTVVSAVATTTAQAADGCGRGMFHDGRRCTPKGGSEFRFAEPGFRDRGSFDRRWSDRRGGDRWSSFDRRRDRGVSVGVGPGVRLHFGDGGRPRLGFSL